MAYLALSEPIWAYLGEPETSQLRAIERNLAPRAGNLQKRTIVDFRLTSYDKSRGNGTGTLQLHTVATQSGPGGHPLRGTF